MDVRRLLPTKARELLGKLNLSARIGIGLAVLVLAGFLLVAVLSGGERYVRLGWGGGRALQALRDLLDQNDVPYRLAGKPGAEAIEVPLKRAAHARWLAAESGKTLERDSNLDWLFGEGSFLDTTSRLDQRLLESRKRTVEDAIRWSRSIRDARIVVQQGPDPIYAAQAAAADSAVVAVALRSGVDSLSRVEAGTIRALVSGAFNIPPQNVQVTDDRLQSYPHLVDSAPGLSKEEERTRRAVLSTVEGLLGRIYRPVEFVVGVLVDRSPRQSEPVHQTYHPQRFAVAGSPSLLDPGRSLPAEPRRLAFRDEEVEGPNAELRGLSVNVVVDRAAVRRVLQAEELTRFTPERRATENVRTEEDIVNFTVEGRLGLRNLDQAIEAHRRAQAAFLRDQLPLSGARVHVSVVMFPRPEMSRQAPVTAASCLPPTWAAGHWTGLLLGGLASIGLLFFCRRLRHRTPPLEVPPLEEGGESGREGRPAGTAFAFEDLIHTRDRQVRSGLPALEAKKLALALKSASPRLRQKLLRNLLPPLAEAVNRELRSLGPARVADIESAQAEVAKAVLVSSELIRRAPQNPAGGEAVA